MCPSGYTFRTRTICDHRPSATIIKSKSLVGKYAKIMTNFNIIIAADFNMFICWKIPLFQVFCQRQNILIKWDDDQWPIKINFDVQYFKYYTITLKYTSYSIKEFLWILVCIKLNSRLTYYYSNIWMTIIKTGRKLFKFFYTGIFEMTSFV